jgi:pilus assembly protein CpaE
VARVRAHLEAAQRPPTNVLSMSAPASVGRVLTVFGSKGGTGKSVVAINLAVALAKQTTRPVVVVDANLQFGDAAIMLQLRPEHTIAEAVLAGDRLDGDMLGDLLLHHKPSGLLVLAAPSDPVTVDKIGRTDLLNIFSLLRERCAYVVVDTSPQIEEATLVALEAADEILMVTNLDVMSLKNSRLGLQTLDALEIPRTKVRLVLNCSNAQTGLTRADTERAMQMKIDTTLPSEPSVAESVNRGVPVVLSAPTSKFALCVDDLARKLRARSSAASRPSQPKPSLTTR